MSLSPYLRRGIMVALLGGVGIALSTTYIQHVYAGADAGAKSEMRRLSQAQYRQTISDVFGEDIKIAGRFEPEVRRNGLLELGNSEVSVTPAGFEQYYAAAQTIAAQVVDPGHRDKLPCAPKSSVGPDSACADKLIRSWGQALFRRPLDKARADALLKSANHAADGREAMKLA